MAAMVQVSLVGYTIGGAFLSLAYFDLLYDIIAILVVLEKALMLKKPLPVPANLPVAAETRRERSCA
jgi:hypothetical protein